MKYKDLLLILSKMSESELNQTVTVWDGQDVLCNPDKIEKITDSDVMDDGHVVLTF